jgi:hypothetical protein
MALSGLVLILGGCSTSPEEMLKAGDPHVCTSAEVKDQLFEIVRQNATPPFDNGFIQDYQRLTRDWLGKVKFDIDRVTSNGADKENLKITCDARLKLTASGIDGERSAPISYEVATDLSKEGEILVSAGLADAKPAINGMLALIAGPVTRQARIDEEAAEQKTARAYEAQRKQDNASEVAAPQGSTKGEYGGEFAGRKGAFSEDESILMKKAEDLNSRCRSGGDNETVCNDRDKMYAQMESRNICWGPDDAYGFEKHWMRCQP